MEGFRGGKNARRFDGAVGRFFADRCPALDGSKPQAPIGWVSEPDGVSGTAKSHPLAVLERNIVACRQCPRLRNYCEKVAREKRRAFLDWTYWGKPVPGFGDVEATIWIVGLAPAAHGAEILVRAAFFSIGIHPIQIYPSDLSGMCDPDLRRQRRRHCC